MSQPGILVIGTGLAGLSFALRSAQHTNVTLLTKADVSETNSRLAQGGIAAVFSPQDSFESHIQDTLNAGYGLCKRSAAEQLVREGPEEIQRLLDLGVPFDVSEGKLNLTREGAHSSRRIVHVRDYTGEAVQRVLVERVMAEPRITIREHALLLDLLVKRGRCTGARIAEGGEVRDYHSETTILATGGMGQLYSMTSNSVAATGDGVAAAWRAGAEIRDIEFIQFHPTVLNRGTSPLWLISEAVRGEGGKLVDHSGEPFMKRYNPQGDLAPRDVVSRAIIDEQKGGPVGIDIRFKGEAYLRDRFPSIYRECLQYGIRMDRDIIPVSPAAHYTCGGITVDLDGASTLPGLYAIGECSCTGVHGANRLASNSTLECLVWSHRAWEKIREEGLSTRVEVEDIHGRKPREANYSPILASLRDMMWRDAGILRSEESLKRGHARLEALQGAFEDAPAGAPGHTELRNMLDAARLVLNAAYTRSESRGTHYMADHPDRDDAHWLQHVAICGEAIQKARHID